MPIKTISAREFNQDTAAAKRAARQGPVVVTDRGRPTHVLLTFEEYNSLAPGAPRKKGAKEKSIVELLAMPEGTPKFDYDFESYRPILLPREIDLD
jgi:prevent-host-death family protein